MRNFQTFIGIDWSGAKTPIHTKSIAVAITQQASKSVELIQSAKKANWSRSDVHDLLIEKAHTEKRTLVGIDCNFGYAQAVGEAQFGIGYNYQDLWAAVEQSCCEDTNYFAGGFWTQPNYAPYFWTQGKQPEGFTMPRRVVEQACGEQGLGWPESPFKLIGAKQVGKGGLAGMRMALSLKQHLGEKIAIWPFEQDKVDQANLIISEIYPRQFIKRAGLGHKKLDQNTLHQALQNIGSYYFENSERIDDHKADAIITAAGLAAICGTEEAVHEHYTRPKGLTNYIAKTEGWIFGVK
tara:strand:- start:429 stop:1313 length:885 start_codon:yes stop_codon:yes gene_type:complete